MKYSQSYVSIVRSEVDASDLLKTLRLGSTIKVSGFGNLRSDCVYVQPTSLRLVWRKRFGV